MRSSMVLGGMHSLDVTRAEVDVDREMLCLDLMIDRIKCQTVKTVVATITATRIPQRQAADPIRHDTGMGNDSHLR